MKLVAEVIPIPFFCVLISLRVKSLPRNATSVVLLALHLM